MTPREKCGARDVALDALMQVDKANAWSDEALRRLIAQNGLDSRDAAFATRLCYGVMQNRMLLDYYIGCWCAQKPERLEPVIRGILRIGGYQILFMDKVPHRAAVNEAVEMTRRRGRCAAAVRGALDEYAGPAERVHGGLPLPAVQPSQVAGAAAVGPGGAG